MIKKAFLVVGGLGLLSAVLFGRDVTSYLATTYDQVTDGVTDSIPTEFQIDRARRMVQDLKPEIAQCTRVIARQQVEVDRLDERIAAMQERHSTDKHNIVRLQNDLKSGDNTFVYAGHRYTSSEVRDDLRRRFERFKTSEETLDNLQQMQEARRGHLSAAKQKLEAMVAAQRQLIVEVENLEAQLKLVQVAEASSDFNFDDSKLARAKELVSSIRTDLDVAARLAAADVQYTGEIQLDDEPTGDVEAEVAAYFGLDGSLEVASVSHSTK